MRYAYNKKTYKLKHKLKILLTILLAVLISTTGYLLSRDAYSSPTDNGVLTIEDGPRYAIFTVKIDGIPISNVEVYDINDNSIGITGSDGTFNVAFNNYEDPSYLIIGVDTISLNYESFDRYTFSYTIPLIGEAYAEFDSSNGQLRIFRDTAGLYTNGQTSGTKTYYTGIETITGTTNPRWYSKNSSITSVVIEDYFRPKTAYQMFNTCANLTTITGIEKLITVDVTDMSSMFRNCSLLTSLNLSGFNTSNVTSMSSMFSYCSNLTSVNISSFNTSNVMNMSYMFNYCSNLESLDLSNFNISSGINMNYMFSTTQHLYTLKLGANWIFGTTSGLSNSWKRDGDTTIYTADELTTNYDGSTMAGTYRLQTEAYAELDTTNGNLRIFRDYPGVYSSGQVGTKKYYTYIERANSQKWSADNKKIKNVTIEDLYKPANVLGLFNGCINMNSITGIENLDVSLADNMGSYADNSGGSGMFENCSSLTSLDLSSLDTSSIKYMAHMFDGCQNLEYLNLDGFDTSHVLYMNSMFSNCEKLKNLDLSSFDTSNVTRMTKMFYYCDSLVNLDLSSFNTTNVTRFYNMFWHCSKLKNLDISSFNTSNATDMSYMFMYCYQLKTIDLSGWDTSNVTTMNSMFSNCENMEVIDVSNFDTSSVTSTGLVGMFSNCKSVQYLDVSSFNTSGVTSFSSTFYYCSKLNMLDLSGWDASNVTTMYYLFAYDTQLNTIKLDVNWSFLSDCSLQYTWKRDGDNTVYTAADLIANYDGSTMAGVYRRADIGMYAIVYDSGELVFQIGAIRDPSKGNILATYTGFDSTTYSNASDVPWYNYRTSITKVTFKDQIIPISTAYWFYGMTNLNKFNKISNLNTVFTTTTQSMFENCTKLSSFNLNNIKTNSLTNMNSMFKGCTNLQSLNMSTFKAENLTNVTDIFTNTNLKTLTLGDQAEFNLLPTLSGTWQRDGNNTTYTGNGVFAGPAGVYRLTTSTKYAIVYDNGEMVFQEGNTPDPTKGNVLGTYTGFETASYIAYSNVPWYSNRNNITKIIFETEVSPKATFAWFYYMSNLTEIENIELLNMTNTTDMSYMFYKSSNLTDLDVSSFDTSSATNMSYMFSDCSSLTSLDVSNFNTNKLKSTYSMFSGCSSLTLIDLSSFNTSNVTGMSYMFSGCNSLTILDISGLETGNVTDMSVMFQNCSNLTVLDVSNFDTSKVINMSHMFFSCSKLRTLDVSNFNTKKVFNMSNMFYQCSSLTTLDVSNFDTSNVSYMTAMFSGCKSLTSLDVSGFYTGKITDLSSMFTSCENLKTLDVSNFNTSKATNISWMFGNCKKLTTLDLSNFNTSLVTNMNYVLNNTNQLSILKLGTNWNFLSQNGLANSWKRDGDNTVYTAAQLTTNYNGSTMAGVYRRVDIVMNAILYDSGELVFQVGSTPDSSLGNVVGTYTGFDSATYTNASSVPWYSNRTSITKITFKDEIDPSSTAYWFYGMTNLNKFNKISNLNTVFTTTTQSMFENCTKLSSFNLNNIKTNSLTNMNSMFKGCTNLQSLNMSTFKAENLTNVTDIFTNTNLKTLTLGDQAEFNILPSLSGIWRKDGSSTTYTGNAVFTGPYGVYRLTTSNVYAIVYDNGEMVFQDGDTPDPTKGNVLGTYNGFETTSYGSYRTVPWYSNRNSITKIIFETEVSPIATKYWFYEITNLTEFENIEYLDMSNVTDMSYMFAGLRNLVALDVSSFDTSNVTNMYYTFALGEGRAPAYDSLITTLDVSGFNTNKVTDMTGMFYGCTNVVALDVSSFDTSNVTTMSAMFHKCSSLVELDLSNFDTSNVIGMRNMFDHCDNITSLDLSNFNTYNVTEMNSMFGFNTSLLSVDLSSFNTSNVTNMNNMFSECSSLTSLDLSNFDTRKVTDIGGMFNNCNSLTNLDLSTFDTSSVTNMGNMFAKCQNLLTLDVSTFVTTRVTLYNGMFQNCKLITRLDLSNFDSSQATQMYEMFKDTNNLGVLKLGVNWQFVENTNLSRSWKRDVDTTIYTAADLTSLYNGATMAGTYYAVNQLRIIEKVKGAMADVNKNFNFTISAMDGTESIKGNYAYTGSKEGVFEFNNGMDEFTLKHNQVIEVYLPIICTYTITQDNENYTVTTNPITNNLSYSMTATFTDTLDGVTPSGILLNLIPFIILIIFGVFGIFLIHKYKYI